MSRTGGVAEWLREHQQAAGIGLLSSAVVLLGIAVAIGYTMITGLSAKTAHSGSSGNPSASAAATASAGAVASVVPSFVAPSFVGAPSVNPSIFTGFQFFDILRVEVTRLAVRVEPTRSSSLLHGYQPVEGSAPEAVGEVRLNPGDFVQVRLGPLSIGDTIWYLVQPAPDPTGSYSGPIWSISSDGLVGSPGWVAAAVGKDQYLTLDRRPDASEYESWFGLPDSPRILGISGSGNYDSGPQARHDMCAFTWAVALGDAPAPCGFAVRLLPDDASEPVVAMERSTAGFDHGPMDGPDSVLDTPWPGSPGGTTGTFTVSIRSGCTWTIGLHPLAHD